MHIKFSKINFYLRFPKSLDVSGPNLSENAQSVQGVPFQPPPGALLRGILSRCPDFRTCWTCFAGNLVQVSRFPHLLDMFCGESCPGVPISAPAGHVLRGILSRCPNFRTCWYRSFREVVEEIWVLVEYYWRELIVGFTFAVSG